MATAEIVLEQAPVRSWTLPRRIPELDGLRGIAILLVLICHQVFWMPLSSLRSVLEQGKVGVDLFFVLSGFLITGILLDTKGRRFAIRNFYVRRGLRIWPLYFTYLAAAMLLFHRMLPTQFAVWPYLLLVQNFFYWTHMGPFLEPTWSLAVEEQFYLLWPFAVARVSRDRVIGISIVVLVLAPCIRFAFRLAGAHPLLMYVNTFCRPDGIAMGAMIAAWVRDPEFSTERLTGFVRIALPIGMLGCAASYAEASTFGADLRLSFVALAFGAVLGAALLAQGTDTPFARMLRSRTLTLLGRVSFALYLFNLPIYNAFHGNFFGRLFTSLPGSLSGVALVLSSNLVLLGVAVCSWKFFESPMLRLKARMPTVHDTSKKAS